MPTVAHLILAYRNPKQLARLVSRLLHPKAEVFIHIDRKADIRVFKAALPNRQDIHFIKKRASINWGGYSMVQATLNAFQEILHCKSYDFVNLMSESDYPLATPDQFIEFLDRHRDKTFAEFVQEGDPWWAEAKEKLSKYHLVDVRCKGKHQFERLLNGILPQRKVPLGMTIVGRSQWLILCREHVQYIQRFLEDNPVVRRFFRYTWGADEIIFQTILFNSPYKDRLVNNNLRYIDWSEGKSSPKILKTGDLPSLKASQKFYARKFDTDVDHVIMDRIDQWIFHVPQEE